MIDRGTHRPTSDTVRGRMPRKRSSPQPSGGSRPRRGAAATKVVRVRLTPEEFNLLEEAAAGDMSNLIRKGLAAVVPKWPAPTTRY